jgi:hypothetical protein
MMEKVAGQQGERCSCFDVMARMASTCCGAQDKNGNAAKLTL